MEAIRKRRLRATRLIALLIGCLSLAGASLAGAATAGAATLKVNTTRDELGGRNGKCSLREAIQTVDSPGTTTACGTAGRTSNKVVLPAGRYRLSIAPEGVDANSTGDLNVAGTGRLTIAGRGPAVTVIDAAALGDRVLSVASRASLTLTRLTITGGHPRAAKAGSAGSRNTSCTAGGSGRDGNAASSAGRGGGIYNAGRLILDEVVVRGNTAGSGGSGGAGGAQSKTTGCSGGNGGSGGSGGGIYNQGKLALIDSSIRANASGAGGPGGTGGTSSGGVGGPGGMGGPGGGGGGIYNRGKLSIAASTIEKDRSGGGGVAGAGGSGAVGIDEAGAAGSAAVGTGVAGAGGDGGSGGGVLSRSGVLRVINSTFASNVAGPGGRARSAGLGGAGGNGGAIEVLAAASTVRNATIAGNRVGPGGSSRSARGANSPEGSSPSARGAETRGPNGSGGGLFVSAPRAADDMKLQNTIVASSIGSNCAKTPSSAIANGGHDLSYGDESCPGAHGNPALGRLEYNGGPTATMALRRGSDAINRVPKKGADCPARDQRGVRRPQGGACDAGAFEFAVPRITIVSPRPRHSYERGLRVLARFRCTEGGITSPLATCKGTVRSGRAINTRSAGRKRFKVIARDKSGNRTNKTVRYTVWAYANPVREIDGLEPGRIDMGVDYVGSGPILALGNGKVTFASNHDSGPLSCWGRTCWPGGGAVVYRLTAGPFAGKYIYAAENIAVTVRVGQTVRAGQRIAILRYGSPFMETGWASGHGPETLAIARGHQCSCADPGGWSSIEGRNFNRLLVFVGARSGYLQPNPPNQTMPRGWPHLPRKASAASIPASPKPIAEGSPISIPLQR